MAEVVIDDNLLLARLAKLSAFFDVSNGVARLRAGRGAAKPASSTQPAPFLSHLSGSPGVVQRCPRAAGAARQASDVGCGDAGAWTRARARARAPGNCTSPAPRAGPSPLIPFSRVQHTVELQTYLLGYEFPDTVMLLTHGPGAKLIVHATAKKCACGRAAAAQ